MRTPLIAIILLTALNFTGAATTQIPDVRIARFNGDRAAAISYTFDDNLRDQYTLAVPMLNDAGFKGTFFVLAGKTADTPEEGAKKQENGNPRNLWGGISWPELKEMSDQGHEIASHTWSHPALTKLSPEDLDTQLAKAHDAILAHVGKPPLTIAFPGNGSNPDVQAAALKHHVAFRSHQQSTSGKSTVESLNAWADKLVREKQWGVLMTHGIAQGYAALSDPGIFRDHLQYVKGRESDIWVDTFANVARYEKERDDAELRVTGKAGDLTCALSGTLDPNTYDVPLTIVISAKGAASARAVRGGKELPVSIGKDSIHIQSAPGPEPIVVTYR